MKYRSDKYGNQISVLGYGCMRLPKTKQKKVNKSKAEKQIMTAYEAGVNYFDTAYTYSGSEAALGEIFEKNQIRDKVYIATKLPHYLVKKPEDIEKMFNEQLKRLRTDHIDYYLLHMLNDLEAWDRIRNMGIVEWIDEKKKSGAIRQIGFSFHGQTDNFCQVVDAYPWELCLIQYNYLDEHAQAGRKGLEYAHAKELPVFVMEPLRGGKLVKFLPEEGKRLMDSHPISHTPAQWAFRWLWDQPEITCVLSGMNSDAMVQDNIETASAAEAGEFTPEDKAMLRKVAAAINKNMKVPCTGCRYCVPCAKLIDIPEKIAQYNQKYKDHRYVSSAEILVSKLTGKVAANPYGCIDCGLCEKRCPQNIAIRKELRNAHMVLNGPVLKTLKKIKKKLR